MRIFQYPHAGIVQPTRIFVTSLALSSQDIGNYSKIVAHMTKVLATRPEGIAISSNQALNNALGKIPSCFLYRDQLYINPSYRGAYDSEQHSDTIELGDGPATILVPESCLSYHEPVLTTRFQTVYVTYHRRIPGTMQFELVREYLKGLDAIVFQHETDHLKGVGIWTFLNK